MKNVRRILFVLTILLSRTVLSASGQPNNMDPQFLESLLNQRLVVSNNQTSMVSVLNQFTDAGIPLRVELLGYAPKLTKIDPGNYTLLSLLNSVAKSTNYSVNIERGVVNIKPVGQSDDPLDRQITHVDFNDVTPRDAIKLLSKQLGIYISYINPSPVARHTKITFVAESKSLRDVLNLIADAAHLKSWNFTVPIQQTPNELPFVSLSM